MQVLTCHIFKGKGYKVPVVTILRVAKSKIMCQTFEGNLNLNCQTFEGNLDKAIKVTLSRVNIS